MWVFTFETQILFQICVMVYPFIFSVYITFLGFSLKTPSPVRTSPDDYHWKIDSEDTQPFPQLFVLLFLLHFNMHTRNSNKQSLEIPAATMMVKRAIHSRSIARSNVGAHGRDYITTCQLQRLVQSVILCNVGFPKQPLQLQKTQTDFKMYHTATCHIYIHAQCYA